MDELIKKYADRLQEIYDKRIAGDHTFSGVLSELMEQVALSCGTVELLHIRHERTVHPKSRLSDEGIH